MCAAQAARAPNMAGVALGGSRNHRLNMQRGSPVRNTFSSAVVG